MKATIVTIGDEILIGQITDTNSGYIAKALEKIGVSVHEMISVSDDRGHILDTFSKLQDTVDFVIITGGLGPTKDDITKKTFCDYFNDTLVMDQKVLDHIAELFKKFSDRPLQQVNIDQALVPSKATVLFNRFGSAPGMWVKKNNTVFMSLPGVPFEMKGIVDYEIIPKIVAEYKRPYIIHKTILTYGMGESMLAEKIEDWENNLPESIKLAYLPSPGRVRLRLSARGSDQVVLEKAITENVESLTKIIGDIIVGFDDSETLEVVLGRLLTQQNRTIATAESCTGGKIASVLASVAGASKYFKGSIVSYAKEVKVNVLNVSAETIQKHSVVSAEVAEEMASNVRQILKTDYGIGVTGNAGPTTDDTDQTVGIVYIALATPNGVFSERFDFGQPREKVIDRAVNKSLEMLHSAILKMPVD
jgi:nicotinamide-nucleotide amidase